MSGSSFFGVFEHQMAASNALFRIILAFVRREQNCEQMLEVIREGLSAHFSAAEVHAIPFEDAVAAPATMETKEEPSLFVDAIVTDDSIIEGSDTLLPIAEVVNQLDLPFEGITFNDDEECK